MYCTRRVSSSHNKNRYGVILQEIGIDNLSIEIKHESGSTSGGFSLIGKPVGSETDFTVGVAFADVDDDGHLPVPDNHPHRGIVAADP